MECQSARQNQPVFTSSGSYCLDHVHRPRGFRTVVLVVTLVVSCTAAAIAIPVTLEEAAVRVITISDGIVSEVNEEWVIGLFSRRLFWV